MLPGCPTCVQGLNCHAEGLVVVAVGAKLESGCVSLRMVWNLMGVFAIAPPECHMVRIAHPVSVLPNAEYTAVYKIVLEQNGYWGL